MFECLKKFWNTICDVFVNAKFNLVDRKKNAPKNIVKDVPRSQIGEIVLSGTDRKPKVYLSDQKYNLASVEDIKNILSMDDTDKARYVSEIYDCDEFAYRLMGHFSTPEWSGFAFGIMWTQTPNFRHAVNCFIDNELQFWVIEPQNDRIFKLPDDWNPFVVFM